MILGHKVKMTGNGYGAPSCAWIETECPLSPIADICSAQAHVRFVPIADIRYLFDHLVRAPD